MKSLLSVVVCALLMAGPVFAQYPGHLGVFANSSGTDCNLYDISPRVIQYYIVHHGTLGAQASRFKAPVPACMGGAIWLSDTTMWPIKIGIVPDGTLVGYGGCQTGTIHVVTINIFGQGLSSDCCEFPILPDPSGVTGEIEVEGCDGLWRPTWGESGYINPTPACHCGVPTEESTWGRVKALYTE